MHRRRHLTALLAAGAILLMAAGCGNGPSLSGNFDRSYPVTGHARVEISSASGDVNITGSADGKIHVHGEVRASGSGQQDAQRHLSDIENNPPIEQTPEGVRVGRDVERLHHASISYTIEVPRDTEVTSLAASGSQSVRGVRGPIKLQSASGSVRAEDIDSDALLTSLSGNVSATNMGDAVRASSTSGDVTVSGAKGDVRANTESGSIQISKPGGRVEATVASGSIHVQGVTGDAKLHGISGQVSVQGNPPASGYWDLKTITGGLDIGVPSGANFHLLAASTSGEIRADFPILIEEQGKHSLRAQIGTGGARIEAHTVSGEIHLSPATM